MLILYSTIIQAQDALRPSIGFGHDEGIQIGINYRIKNVQFYSYYARHETSFYQSSRGYIIGLGIQNYFGKKNEIGWRSWYIKSGINCNYNSYKDSNISGGEMSYDFETRIGRESELTRNLSLGVDIGLLIPISSGIGNFAGGIYLLYNIGND